nr:MAG TPA: hypothetical protein [Bacteriophage sp.]
MKTYFKAKKIPPTPSPGQRIILIVIRLPCRPYLTFYT